MARAGINKALVQDACDALRARGVHPSIDAVRVELGNTGSKSTIQRYLKELSERDPTARAVNLSDELLKYISSLAERLTEHALAAVAEDRARLQRQQETLARQRIAEQARLEQMQQSHATALAERREGLERERALSERLNEAEGERQRLREAKHSSDRLLEERATQILSLEDKHRHARAALKHYRQQQAEQREHELSQHEVQLQHLQQERRTLLEQVLAKQEEASQMYRDLERLNGEQRQQQQQTRACERELQELRLQLQVCVTSQQTDQQHIQALFAERAALHEKAKRYLLMHRQDSRSLRKASEQIKALQLQLAEERDGAPHA
jgi:hypothetical protein